MSRKPMTSAVYELMRRRISRRDVLFQGGLIAIGSAAGCSGEPEAVVEPEATVSRGFIGIVGSDEDRVILPEGFGYDVVARWGDAIDGSEGLSAAGIPSGGLLEAGAASVQSRAFGTSCDGLGVFPLSEDRLIICVNHETPETSRMFPGWREALRDRTAMDFIRENPEAVAVMRASVGVSVLEIEQTANGWQVVDSSPLNRRITADTLIEFSGPAAGHPWLGGSESAPGTCFGTLGNCAAGATPWGTYLTAEENTNDYFGNAADAGFEPLLQRANERFGMRPGPSVYRWEAADERFDHVANPAESMKFGWIVEIDPANPGSTVRKRTALGRMRHEGATTVLTGEGRPVVYLGDDSSFEYLYKFVSNHLYDPDNPDNTDVLLDDGTLYVARLDEDGSGQWLALEYGRGPLTEENDFSSQADVVLRCREAADLLGATPLDRPEDVAVHPGNGLVYLSCTQGVQRGLQPPRDDDEEEAEAEQNEDETPAFPGPDAANPRGPNPYGHILEFAEDGADAAAEDFRWEVFILAGDPAERGLASAVVAGRIGSAVAYYAGISDSDGLAGFACPDNLGFDAAGNLWIVTDGAQPSQNNNGCFVCPTEGPERGQIRQFLSGPVGAEICGCTFSPDGNTLFMTIQHPGSGSSIAEPSSHWPDGGDAQPRSSLIAIRATDPQRHFYS